MRARLRAHLDQHDYPYEPDILAVRDQNDRWQPLPLVEPLKEKAGSQGLWNLFPPDSADGAGLNNCDYAPLAEEMGRSPFISEIFHCPAPRYRQCGRPGPLHTGPEGTLAQAPAGWRNPLRLCHDRTRYCLIRCAQYLRSSERDGNNYVLNGHKWWAPKGGDPRCKVLIFMGQSSPHHDNPWKRQSMILAPMDIPGITINPMVPVFGYDDAPMTTRMSHSRML